MQTLRPSWWKGYVYHHGEAPSSYSVWVNCLLAEDTETSPCQTGSKFDSFCDSYQTYHANMPVTIPSVFYTQYAWDMSGTFKPKESFYNHKWTIVQMIRGWAGLFFFLFTTRNPRTRTNRSMITRSTANDINIGGLGETALFILKTTRWSCIHFIFLQKSSWTKRKNHTANKNFCWVHDHLL